VPPYGRTAAHRTRLLTGRATAAVLADGRTTALLAARALAVVLADGRTTALLAGRATAVVLADARTTALLAGRANAVVLAMSCGMLCCLRHALLMFQLLVRTKVQVIKRLSPLPSGLQLEPKEFQFATTNPVFFSSDKKMMPDPHLVSTGHSGPHLERPKRRRCPLLSCTKDREALAQRTAL
jgi:hypothetical protein